MRDEWKGVLGFVLVIAAVVIVVFYGLDTILQMIWTEVIGWSVLSAVVLPGSLVTAAIDQLTPLDRAQLWTLSIVFTSVIFVVFVTLARLTGTPDVLLWYGVLVGSLLLLTAVLFFGFKVRWIGTFLSRFAFGPELFNADLWMPVVIQLVVASWMALAGTAAAALGWTASVAFSRVQLWMLAIVLNGVAAAALAARGRRRRSDFFERFVIGYFLVGAINVLATIVGCVLYFGCRVTVLAAAFSQFAPQWPDWFD